LVYLPPHRTTHAIVVDKSRARLSLFKHDRQGLRLVERFRCSLGKEEGEKSRPGDLKTPSGIFWLEDHIPQERLPRRYGAGALVLNYPNFFDRLQGRRGDGIWVHGTDRPKRVRFPKDTEGCIVVTNEDFRKIETMVRLFETPLIVQPKVVYLKPERWRAQQRTLLERLQTWLGTWRGDSGRSPDSLYGEPFHSDPKGASHFLKLRAALTRGFRQNRVRVKDLFILRDGTTALSMFIQEWRTEHGTSHWTKVLYWLRDGDLWRIVGEKILERPVLPSVAVMREVEIS
jgi:hypothetical protein